MACRDDDDSSGGRGKRKCADFVGDGIAGHLLKWVHFQQDTEGRDVGLFYFRDTDGREVDFILAEKVKPITAIELQVVRLQAGQEPALLENSVPRLRRVAAVGHRRAGLRDAGGDPSASRDGFCRLV